MCYIGGHVVFVAVLRAAKKFHLACLMEFSGGFG